jgi:CubicO group peptidase (beta-lactamase class C family)
MGKGGLTLLGRQRLRVVAERYVGDDAVPGLVALVAHGDDVHVETLGSLCVGGAPVRRDSIFRLSSTTKPITAAAIMALVDEGLLVLEWPVDRLLPELGQRQVLRHMDGPLDDTVPAARAVTVRDLLTFTFGFGLVLEMFTAPTPWPVVQAAQSLGLSTIGPPDRAAQPDPDTWIARLGTLPLLAQPGERWMYNTGASVLGVLAARAAGEPFVEVLKSRVLRPLGMADTAFFTTATDRLATAYRSSPEGLVAWDQPDGLWSHAPAFPDGAAGLVSTVDDLWAFARMFLEGGAKVLSAESVHEMTTDQLSAEQKAAGGLGPDFFDGRSWGFCQAVLDNGAFGWDGGFGTSWLVDPERDLVVIVLTQRMWETSDLPAVHRDLQAAAYAAVA